MGLNEEGLKRSVLCAQALPQSLCPLPLLDWLNRQTEGSPIVVACSGGADSVALLLWLTGHFRDRFQWVVAHVNHGTRGDASEADAQFVKDLAAQLGLPYELRSFSNADGESEAGLRKLRWEALTAIVKKWQAVGVFLGHHRDDVVENLLFRLSRGAGLEGLSGMRAIQSIAGGVPRLRPFLNCDRDALRTTLESIEQSWCEDESNQAGFYLRNRIRKRLIAELSAVFDPRDWREGFRQSHQQLGEAFECIDQLATQFIEEQRGNLLDQKAFSSLPHAIQRRVLASWLFEQSGEAPGERLLGEVLRTDRDQGVGKWSLGSGFLRFDGEVISWSEQKDCPDEGWNPIPVDIPFHLKLPMGGEIAGEWFSVEAEGLKRLNSGTISEEREAWLVFEERPVGLVIRQRKTGDRYQPLGTKGHKKLQDAFVDRKIPRSKRSKLPIVCNLAGEILWVPGLPPSHLFKLESKTQFALRLTYEQG